MHAIRAELQRSKAPAATLARRYGINEKTVRKWRSRPGVEDDAMGPKERRSTVLSALEEAAIVSLRVQARLPAYNYAKQLKALRFGTPFEAIRQLNDKKPEIVIRTPSHDMLGPNN